MSLFKIVEWNAHHIPEASAITTGPFFENREQLVVGGEDGSISVIDPCGTKDAQDTTVLHYQTKRPVLQMRAGEFLPFMGVQLAVLSPNRLSYYRIVYDEKDETSFNFEEIYGHEIEETAYNMCTLPFQNIHILVQTVLCNLYLYQGDQCIFSKSPLPFLLPGPICYSLPSSSLLLGNDGRISSLKFSLLTSVSNSSKKVTFDWEFSLGDYALDIEVEDRPPIQPSLVVLCRRGVNCFTTGGMIRWQIRLESVATAMCLYRLPGIETAYISSIIATADENMLVFRDERLVWNCNAHMAPVALLVSTYSSLYENVLTLMSSNGKVIIGYPGTEPNLYKLPPENRIINYKEKAEQLKSLESKIKETQGKGEIEPRLEFGIKLTCSELQKASMEHNTKGPVCILTVQFNGVAEAQKIHINVRSSLSTPSRQIVLHKPREGSQLKIPFFVGKEPPTSSTVNIAAHCYPSQASSYRSIEMPMELLFHECSLDRNSKYKFTLDTDCAVVPINSLFPAFQTDNPLTIGLQVHSSDATVSIFAANKSNRYRVQSDRLGLLQVATAALIQRLRETVPNINIGGKQPIEYISLLLDNILEHKKLLDAEKERMESRMREVRCIEALLLNKSKNTKLENLDHIDALFSKSHQQLLAAMDAYTTSQNKYKTEIEALGSLFQLTADVMRCQKAVAYIDGNFYVNTTQSLKERLQWASRMHRSGESSMVEALCQHARKDLPQITEEEEPSNEPVAENAE